jgi:membrane protease YdiL (CAAX protease family)
MQSATVSAMAATRRRWLPSPYVVGYLVLYGLTLWLLQRSGEEVGEMAFALVVFGGFFPALTWLVTLRAQPLPVTVRRPGAESTLIVVYLIPMFAYLIWGVGLLKAAVPAEPAQDFAILGVKLLLWVLVPGVLIANVFGYSPHELTPLAAKNQLAIFVLCVAMIAIQCVLGRGLHDMKESGYSAGLLLGAAPLTFLWLIVEVGIVEEFFFRALLQTRVARLLRSEAGGIVVASVLFGLVHAPGFYLRTVASQETLGTHPSVLMAVGYSLVVTSAAGIFMGVLWSRTRNFAAVVLVHAAGDLVPGIVPMLHSFMGK